MRLTDNVNVCPTLTFVLFFLTSLRYQNPEQLLYKYLSLLPFIVIYQPSDMKTIYILPALMLTSYICMSQCYVLNACTQANFNEGANCHGFSYRYLQKQYNLSSLTCGVPSVANRDIIYDCLYKYGFMSNTSFAGYLDNATSSDHTVILYKDASGGITHSAVKLASNSYISKWESSGPLVIHGMVDVPYDYYHSGYTITYHKFKTLYFNPNDPPATIFPAYPISFSACTSCSCRTGQGYFLVSASMSPSFSWTTATWSVSGASIALTGNNYIYVDKPGGGSVGVTANANYTYKQYCTKAYSKFQLFFFPSCSGGGFLYSLREN
jgi:hypothetical protein